MSAPFKLVSLTLEIIKLPIDDDKNPFVLVRDRLIAAYEVNDAQPRVTETEARIGGQPCALAVWAAVVKTFRGVP
jgi:hypothetical protein